MGLGEGSEKNRRRAWAEERGDLIGSWWRWSVACGDERRVLWKREEDDMEGESVEWRKGLRHG